VIVVDGPYLRDRALHDALVRRNAEDGNEAVGMLFCVPPAIVEPEVAGHGPRSVPAVVFAGWGFRTWDGAVPSVRESYPTAIDQLRIVQYESCRGLEGWTVVNLAFDRFYDHKLKEGETLLRGRSAEGMASSALLAQRFAARWLTIPLTRAMDTLVIQLDLGASPVRDAVERASVECGEVVEWKHTR
jgi:hypothetical protein